MDLTALVSRLMGSQGTGEPSGLLSNLPPPAPLSGLTFAEPGFSGATSSLGGSPGDEGLVPGQGAGPGLDILSLLGQFGNEGVANTSSLLAPIGGTVGTGTTPNVGVSPTAPDTGQNTVIGRTDTAGPPRTEGSVAGETGGTLPALSLIASALGLLGKSGLFANLGATPDLGTRGDVDGVSLSDQLRNVQTPTADVEAAYANPPTLDALYAVGADDYLTPETQELMDIAGAGADDYLTPDAPGTVPGPLPEQDLASSSLNGSTLSGGLSATSNALNAGVGFASGDVPRGVGGMLGAGANVAGLSGANDLASGASGLGSLLSLVEGARSGNPVQVGQGALGAYNSLNTLWPETFPTLSSLASVGGELGGAVASNAALGATEAGIGLGSGSGFGGAATSGMAAGLAPYTWVITSILSDALSQQAERDARTSGRWNNPIKGDLSSKATAGVASATNRLNAQDLSTTSTESLLADLPKVLDELLPYYATAQGGIGAIKASDTVTGGSGAAKSAASGDAGQYTADFTNAQTKLLDVVNTLLDRGVSYETFGAVPASGRWAEQTRDLANPLDAYFARSQAPGQKTMLPAGSRGQPVETGADETASLLAQLVQPTSNVGTDVNDPGNLMGVVAQHPAAATAADLFQAAQGAGQHEGARATTNITDMYGGPLWTALARMGLGGDAMTSRIQDQFDPWVNVRTQPVEALLAMLVPPTPEFVAPAP